ncbi:hypothetical protein [Nonomuraea fuscirosea]|uniref:hypothetical protein n=1 Tax=Nonomuraea fuscirosea TaxID=1291556 RepID=UPI0034163285
MTRAEMLAARLHIPSREVRVEEVPVPEPGPGQVRVEVRAAGVWRPSPSRPPCGPVRRRSGASAGWARTPYNSCVSSARRP